MHSLAAQSTQEPLVYLEFDAALCRLHSETRETVCIKSGHMSDSWCLEIESILQNTWEMDCISMRGWFLMGLWDASPLR